MKTLFKASAVAIALVGLTLAGCNSPDATADNTTAPDETTIADDNTAAGETVVFNCPDGETVTAQFTDADEAIVTLPDQAPLTLPATEAASGARYSDGTTTFWNKGDEAMVEIDDTVVLSGCQAQG